MTPCIQGVTDAAPDAPTPPRLLTADEMNIWADGVMDQVTAARREAQELRVQLAAARSALAWLLEHVPMEQPARRRVLNSLGKTQTKRGRRG